MHRNTIREKREGLSREYLLEICREGGVKAKAVAQRTLEEVKEAMGANF